MTLVTMVAWSCKETKNDQTKEVEHRSEMNAEDNQHHDDAMMESSSGQSKTTSQTTSSIGSILTAYLQLKEALVADDAKSAAKMGTTLVSALNDFDAAKFPVEQKSEVHQIVENATKQASDITNATLDLQREHFKLLSGDLMDLVAITGTPMTLYQQFCPMYDQGSAWLSASNEVKNPYYGSKMLNCGIVKATIQ